MSGSRRFAALFRLGLVLLLAAGCRSLTLPPPPPGVELRPGQYVGEYFAAPDFDPAAGRYQLAPLRVEEGRTTAAAFPRLFQEELSRAFAANGLTLGLAPADYRLSAVIHRVEVSRAFRWWRGRISAHLLFSGTITHKERVVFACRDAVTLSSPVAPGPAAPREEELLLRQLARTAAQRLLNQMLLYRFSDPGARSANTLSTSRGRRS